MRLVRAASCALFAASGNAQNVAGNDLTFDGLDDVAVVKHSSSLSLTGDFTLEAWVKLPAKQSDSSVTSGIVGKGSGKFNTNFNYYLAIRNTNNTLHFLIGDRTGNGSPNNGYHELRGTTNLGTQKWTHVAAVRSTRTLAIYVNGLPEGKPVARTITQVANADGIRMGGIALAQSRFNIDGKINEIRIWNVARTPQQIRSSYKCSLDPKTVGLVAYWQFNELVADQRVLDSTANINHGVLGNTSSIEKEDPKRSASTLELGPFATKYGTSSGGNNTLNLDWLPIGKTSQGFVVVSKAKANGTGMFFVSLGPASIKLLGVTVLIDLSPGMFPPPLPIAYDSTGGWGFPMNLRTAGLGGITAYAQVLEQRSGVLHLSNGLKMQFCQ